MGLFLSLKFQSQSTLFFHTHFGSEGDDIGNSVIQDFNGEYYCLGETDGNGANQKDVMLAKINNLGILIWKKNFGGMNADIGKAIIQLPDSSLMFTGYTNSFGNGGYDAYIVKTTKDGSLIWQKTFGGLDWDFAYSINKTTDGNIIICGATYSYGQGDRNAFILKLDYNGNFIWNKTYGGTEEDELRKIIQTADGGYIAAGTTKSYGDTLGDIWITKFNSMGDSVWFKTDGGVKMEVGNSIVQNINGDYLVTGGSESFSFGKEDAYISKFSNNGSFVWRQYYGSAGGDEESYEVLNSHSTYGDMVITYGTRQYAAYGLDIKTLLLDFQGYYVRGGNFGGPYDDIGYSLFNTLDKGYVACGYTKSFGAVNTDFFVVKYDSEMTIGPLIVSIKNDSRKSGFNLYPTLISEGVLYAEFPDGQPQPFSVEIFDLYGIPVESLKIEEVSVNKFRIHLPENLNGMVIVSLNKGEYVKKCIVR